MDETQTQLPKWLGAFYGSNFGLLHYELFTIANFTSKQLMPEAGLMEVKWFDYRQLHPLQATYYFVKCYTQAYRNFTRKAINVDIAPYVRCFSDVDFVSAREKVSVLQLRQLVDRLGMRYDFFLNFAMDWHHKMSDVDGRVHAPRPGHLLSNEELIADVMLAWEEQCEIRLQIAKNSYYRTSEFNYRDRDQYAHEAFMLKQVMSRKHPRFSLGVVIYEHDVVRFYEACDQLGKELVIDAIKEVDLA